jgi:predicted alpha/beta superfamily hydrolase
MTAMLIARASTASAIALVSVLLVVVSSCSEPGQPERSGSGDNPLAHLPALRGDYFPFDSQAVGRRFHIYVRLPENYAADESARYPVVYVLDGDSLFPILAASHLFLTNDEDLPEAIVVGIAYGSFDPSVNRRGFDFTAPLANADPERGGAPAFHDFLKSELIPRIENRFRADPSRRVLFGQSRGGSMVLYSAFTDPDVFWGRIASNPALDLGHELFFSPAARASREDLGLVVTSGSRDRPDLREAALEWFGEWETVKDKPWSLRTITIEGGTHAADSSNSYRAGMLWLFDRQ